MPHLRRAFVVNVFEMNVSCFGKEEKGGVGRDELNPLKVSLCFSFSRDFFSLDFAGLAKKGKQYHLPVYDCGICMCVHVALFFLIDVSGWAKKHLFENDKTTRHNTIINMFHVLCRSLLLCQYVPIHVLCLVFGWKTAQM